jgi:hypothetical protein
MSTKTKDPKRVKAGKKAKRKGISFERLVVGRLRDAGFSEVKRGWWQSGEAARLRGKKTPVPDIFLDGFWAELGHGRNMDDYAKLDQALKDFPGRVESRLIPISITRKDTERVIRVTMALVDLEDLVARSRGEQRYAWRSPVDIILPIRVSLRLEDFCELLAAARECQENCRSTGNVQTSLFEGADDMQV